MIHINVVIKGMLRCVALFGVLSAGALADEQLIRKNLAARIPQLPKIDEVVKTPVGGLYEVRTGNDVQYTDEQGNFLIQGNIIDTRTQVDLTEERIGKLTAIEFAKLPLADALVVKQGTGRRRVAVFFDLSRRSKAYGYYTKVDDTKGVYGGKFDAVAVGVRHNF